MTGGQTRRSRPVHPGPPLLLVSGHEPTAETIADGPRLDYLELSRALGGAPLLYAPRKRGPVGEIEERTASDLRQALRAFRARRRHSVFVSFSEKVGLPLALLLGRRHVPHVLLAHNLTSERKRVLQRRTGILNRFDAIVLISREQARYLTEDAKVDANRVHCVECMVDSHFWTETAIVDETDRHRGPILSVGRERRDYRTLARAARSLPKRKFVIVASSLWSRDRGQGEQAEENLEIRRNLPYGELRKLYAQAGAVVVPLEADTAYAAGVNVLLEAMATGNGPIVTRTPGIVEYVEDGVTGRWAPAGNAEGLAAVIEAHLGQPEIARRIGAAARRVVDCHRNAEMYVSKLEHIVNMVREN